MIDLTNKNIGELAQKYSCVLELIKNKDQIPHLAYIIDYSVNFIKQNYSPFTDVWKAFGVVVVRHQWQNGKINNEQDIDNLLIGYFQYLNDNYEKYINSLGIVGSEYDRDYGIVRHYIDYVNGKNVAFHL